MQQLDFRIFIFGIVMPFVVSMVLVFLIHPFIVKVAKMKNIVDNPDARKLQKEPVPVLGGMAVYFGIVVGAGVVSIFFNSYALFTCVVAMTVMMYIGLLDDIVGLSPVLRLILEILVIGFVVKMDLTNMNDFHGLFGIHKLPVYLSLPLCAFAGAGIINSINLIDGVNGLCSGFCIMACIAFGSLFALSFDGTMAVIAFLTAGGLIPFFIHNVFGNKSRMFIGDCGSLMMGVLMTIFVMRIMDNTSRVAYNYPNMGVIAFCLSILSVPVFDTVRVMLGRIMRGGSPFEPDKSHLHHLFIEIGFSHFGTMVSVISLDFLTFLVWLLSYQLGASVTWQFIIVFIMGTCNTFGFYYTVRRMNHERRPYRFLRWCAMKSHLERESPWKRFTEIIDKM